MKEQEWTKRSLQDEAYRIYQLRWMIDNGCSARTLAENVLKSLESVPADAGKAFAAWESGPGFGDAIWKTKKEFLKTDYLDRNYVYGLLPAEPYAAYLDLWKSDDLT